MLVAKFTHSGATSFVQVCCTFKQQLLKKHAAECKASARVPDVWVHFCFGLCDFSKHFKFSALHRRSQAGEKGFEYRGERTGIHFTWKMQLREALVIFCTNMPRELFGALSKVVESIAERICMQKLFKCSMKIMISYYHGIILE
jgi:hypothetical protein